MNDAYRAGGPHQGELAQIRSVGQDVEISSGRAPLQHCGPVHFFLILKRRPEVIAIIAICALSSELAHWFVSA